MPIFREYTSMSSEVHTKLITHRICVCKVVQQLFMGDLNEENTLRIAKCMMAYIMMHNVNLYHCTSVADPECARGGGVSHILAEKRGVSFTLFQKMHENAIFSLRTGGGGVRRVRPMLDPPLHSPSKHNIFV